MLTETTVIDTTGEVVGEEQRPAPKSEVNVKDVPIYTVARAVEWLKRPENAPRIEQAAKMAGEVTRDVARYIDHEITKVGRLGIQLATDDDVLEDFTNSLLKSLLPDDLET